MTYMERWRPVVEAPERYEVSDFGRVRSLLGRTGPHVIYIGRGTHGHRLVSLHTTSGRVGRLVHRLVMEAFVGPCPEGMEVRHLDGDASNNGTHVNGSKTHCKNGHEFTPENTRVEATGSRRCRTCANAYSNQWYRKRRMATR